jgi:protocatechuate 3,4-dioxygenase beta subunit
MTITNHPLKSRRRFLARLGVGAAAVAAVRLFEPGVFAEELEKTRVLTPRLTQGPFYPDHLPLDTDNDLLVVNDALTPAVGTVTHLSGRVLDARGDAVRNALVEIWQVDNTGSYLHSRGTNPNAGRRDPNFQGYGRFLTGSTGEFYFRTIKPVPYPGRTPPIHVKVHVGGGARLTTQFFDRAEPRNARDMVLRGVRDPAARATVLGEYVPLKGATTGEMTVKYDVVLGLTPSA